MRNYEYYIDGLEMWPFGEWAGLEGRSSSALWGDRLITIAPDPN